MKYIHHHETSSDIVQYKDTTVENFLSSVVNPNLLINSDFRTGFINQHGRTNYECDSVTKNVSTIDCWIMGSTDQIMTFGSNYIRVTKRTSGNYCLLYQVIELLNRNSIVNKRLTLTLRIRSSIKSKFRLYSTDTYADVDTAWKTLSITFNSNDVDNNSINSVGMKVWIGCVSYNNPTVDKLPQGFYFDIEFVKLEEGSCSTGMPIWNYANELTKCYRYMYNLGVGWRNQYFARSDSQRHLIMLNTPTRLARVPDLINADGVVNGTITVSGNLNTTQNLKINDIVEKSYTRQSNVLILVIPVTHSSQQIGYGCAVFNDCIVLDANLKW